MPYYSISCHTTVWHKLAISLNCVEIHTLTLNLRLECNEIPIYTCGALTRPRSTGSLSESTVARDSVAAP